MNPIKTLTELSKFISNYKNKKVMITFHSVGDTDAVLSAFVLSSYFSKCTITMPDRITSNARRILRNDGYNPNQISNQFVLDADLIILMDVNNFEGCGDFAPKLSAFNAQILIIDHHATIPISSNLVYSFNDETHNSTASIVTDLFDLQGRKLTDREARLLLMGIISDSAEFKNSTPKTFFQIGKLLQVGKTDYPKIIEEMFIEPQPEVREESINELFNASMLIKNNLLIMYGNVQGPANIPADNAIKIGADVSIFKSESKKEISLSSRLRPPLDEEHGIHLGKIMHTLSPIIDGNGGGHPCAAGAYGTNKGAGDLFIKEFINLIISRT